MASSKRPEYTGPPELFYNEQEAAKYTTNTRIIEIQTAMSERAIELLALPDDAPRFILDLGCGSGLSGDVLEEQGHYWVGVDISQAMLDIAIERETEGDKLLGDLGQGIPFRAGAFDGAISISALQWLCNADKKWHNPVKRLQKFFSTLYSCLGRGSRAVFQFYPDSAGQIELVTQQAMKAGFTGGLVVDFPNSTKAKKMFLVLFTGGPQKLPEGLGEESGQKGNQVEFTARRNRMKQLRGKGPKHGAAWIQAKKERRRRQGKETRPDSKYTGRRRCGKF